MCLAGEICAGPELSVTRLSNKIAREQCRVGQTLLASLPLFLGCIQPVLFAMGGTHLNSAAPCGSVQREFFPYVSVYIYHSFSH